MYTHTHTHSFLYPSNHPNMDSHWCFWLTQYYRFHFSLPFLCIYNFPLQHWETWLPTSNIHLCTYFLNPNIYIKNCLPVPMWKKPKQYLYTVPFVFRLRISTQKYYFPKLLRSAPFPSIPFGVVMPFICNPIRIIYHRLHCMLGSPPHPGWYQVLYW